ncbi:hypothetical protein PGT21_000509 [Puccinia graminis f. sp. tritici]|uniref:Uncharacterized protein n=1 Tax=Puccinia graminis f. sp. tritici TaxID=56615 RepID=A0A5B0Q110_PUCGR|nr:hypothetical protein PGT21_000509 [Puccinia graminis f. sp. tritici]
MTELSAKSAAPCSVISIQIGLSSSSEGRCRNGHSASKTSWQKPYPKRFVGRLVHPTQPHSPRQALKRPPRPPSYDSHPSGTSPYGAPEYPAEPIIHEAFEVQSLALSKQRIDARLLLAEILWLQSPARFRAHRSSAWAGPSPGRGSTGYTLLATALGLGALASGATVYALQTADLPDDPLAALAPDALRLKAAHVAQKAAPDLLRSYLTLLLCEIPGVATYGPLLLNHCISLRDNVPILGPATWSVVEWYTGGSRRRLPAGDEALYEGEVGSLLNYSVEALEGAGKGSSESGLSRESVAAITRTVESLAGYESGAKGYAASSARMKPSAVAIKVSGLVDDPYLFKRASENLLANGLSPFRVNGSPSQSSTPTSLILSPRLTISPSMDC